MFSIKLKFYLCIILFSLGSVPINAQVIPCPTINNYIIDLENYNVLGTRKMSGSITDYMDIQGAIEITKQDYDYAIVGCGFFKILNEIDNNMYYTRCGKFTKHGNSFYNENGHRILLSKTDFDKLCDVNKNNAAITLYYPDNIQEIRIIDNKKWTTNINCKILTGNVVFHALEQNPTELKDLLIRIREEICINYEDENNDMKYNCLKLIDKILGSDKDKAKYIIFDQETVKKTKKLVLLLIKLENEKEN